MKLSLLEETGLPVEFDLEAATLILGDGLNWPAYSTKTVRDHELVWASPVPDEDRVMYYYTGGLWLAEDEAAWKEADVIYGLVVIPPGTFGNEFVKSSGQYHPLCNGNRQATPEIYSVLHGTGHFLLQKSSPPYDVIEDAVLVEVQAGETFVVPPDYGHLQINPTAVPLVFSYAVMDGMKGVYEPFRQRRGAIYYEMADGPERFVFNRHYPSEVPLRFVKAAEMRQMTLLAPACTYQTVRDNLPHLRFLTDPTQFPETAHLPVDEGTLPAVELRRDPPEPRLQGTGHRRQAGYIRSDSQP
jgi:glucose-6-phosphate isomerase, archaeal